MDVHYVPRLRVHSVVVGRESGVDGADAFKLIELVPADHHLLDLVAALGPNIQQRALLVILRPILQVQGLLSNGAAHSFRVIDLLSLAFLSFPNGVLSRLGLSNVVLIFESLVHLAVDDIQGVLIYLVNAAFSRVLGVLLEAFVLVLAVAVGGDAGLLSVTCVHAVAKARLAVVREDLVVVAALLVHLRLDPHLSCSGAIAGLNGAGSLVVEKVGITVHLSLVEGLCEHSLVLRTHKFWSLVGVGVNVRAVDHAGVVVQHLKLVGRLVSKLVRHRALRHPCL